MQNPLDSPRLVQASFGTLERLARHHALATARYQPQLFAELGPDCFAVRVDTEFDENIRKSEDDTLKHATRLEIEFRDGRRLQLNRPEDDDYYPSEIDEDCENKRDVIVEDARSEQDRPERFELALPQLIAQHITALIEEDDQGSEDSHQRTEDYLFWHLLTVLPYIGNLPSENGIVVQAPDRTCVTWTAEYLKDMQAPQAPACYVDLNTLSQADQETFA